MVRGRRLLRLLLLLVAAAKDVVKVVSTKVADYDRSHAARVVGRSVGRGVQETRSGLLRAGCSGGGDGGGRERRRLEVQVQMGGGGVKERQRAGPQTQSERRAELDAGNGDGAWWWWLWQWCQSSTGCCVLGAGRWVHRQDKGRGEYCVWPGDSRFSKGGKQSCLGPQVESSSP